MSVDTILKDAESKMGKSIEHLESELTSIRTGRANPALIERVMVPAYGTPMPLNQLAQISAPEARLLVVQVYDRSQMGAVERWLLIVAFIVLLPVAAYGAYLALGSGSGSAAAANLPAPGKPTVTASSTGLSIAWTSTALSTGRAVDNYQLRRTIGATNSAPFPKAKWSRSRQGRSSHETTNCLALPCRGLRRADRLQ